MSVTGAGVLGPRDGIIGDQRYSGTGFISISGRACPETLKMRSGIPILRHPKVFTEGVSRTALLNVSSSLGDDMIPVVVAECWAKCLGDCRGKITGEHIITEGIWASDEIGVSGLPWCRETHQFIGVKNFTKNMLCERHNSTLSPVDQGGIAAFDTFRQAAAVHNQRSLNIESGFRTGRFDLCTYKLDGTLLERWFLKTLINIEFAGAQNLTIGPYFGQPIPACDLVEVAYGKRSLTGNAGLYFVAGLRETVKLEERVKYTSLIATSAHGEFVAAGQFVFFGFTFLLLVDPAAKIKIEKPSVEMAMIHRPYKLLFTVNELPSQEIEIPWPDRPAQAPEASTP